MMLGFLPPDNMDAFHKLAMSCYRTAVTEFNKSIRDTFGENRFSGWPFTDAKDIYQLVDAALKSP
jgi:hypothetical protein